MAKRKPDERQPLPPLVLDHTTRFDLDAKLLEKRGKSMDKLHAVIRSLRTHEPLARKHRDHALSGDWEGWRDCHVEPDWVLIYKKEVGTLILGRTGTHADLGL